MKPKVLGLLLLMAFLGGMVAYIISVVRQAEPRDLTPPPPSKWDTRILDLDVEAIDAAYKEQIMHLFSTWMKDETGQPTRAVTGAQNARKAYIGAMIEIEKRRK